MTERPRLLIEDWLPIKELGIESRRESAPIPGQFPKIKTLHVWWARRPLAACAGVILNSLLPVWSQALADQFKDDPRVASDAAYRRWTLHLAGVWGDPIKAKREADAAIAAGARVANPYTYKQAFKNQPNPADLSLLHEVLVFTWGELPSVIDPTAGGGSIPYEAARYGLPAIANDLNSVAACVLRAGIEVTQKHGLELRLGLEKWGSLLVARSQDLVAQYFPSGPSESVATYLFARSVSCPRTEKTVPLSPNWWLCKDKGKEAAVRIITEVDGRERDEPAFEVLFGKDAVESIPDEGTVSGGNGVSIWDGLPIDGDHIKAEAQAGRMGAILYAVAVRLPVAGKSKTVLTFRAPTATDFEALAAAEAESARLVPGWLAKQVLPNESIPKGNDNRPANYGMKRWIDMFSARQLLVHGTFVEEFQRILPEIIEAEGEERGRAIAGVLAMMQGKGLDWNSAQCIWDSTRSKIGHTFTTHSFSFKWTFPEFSGPEFFLWLLDQTASAYKSISALYEPGDAPHLFDGEIFRGAKSDLKYDVPGEVTVYQGTAGNLSRVATGSQVLVAIDPPYYDNVMYAELSDFFGVWEQHMVGRVWPDLMPGGLADVANEAVANPARFRNFGTPKRAKELANSDYQAKMLAIFDECKRVMRDDGVMTVMFTHKRAEAWDTLGMALMEAGFEIATSWPVNTESEASLHQAKKNSAASTVMLVCRKRALADGEAVFFEDLVPRIRDAARRAITQFEADGIIGVDLLLSTYGPVLSVISAVWPVYSSEASADGSARLLRPEEALDVARAELVESRRKSIVGHDAKFDAATDFWLIAWDTFQAEEFPYDEARRLALAVGGQDPEQLAALGLILKKSGTVVLQAPEKRRKRVLRPVQDGEFADLSQIDILHGVIVTADLDGLAAAKALMDRYSLTSDPRFLALVQGAVNAVPRTKKSGKFIRPEAAALDALSTAYLPSIKLPEEEPSDRLFDVADD